MPSITSCCMSFEPAGCGVALPLGDPGAGELRGEFMVGCESRLNMEVTGGAPANVVFEGCRDGRVGGWVDFRVSMIADDCEACNACISDAGRVALFRFERGSSFPKFGICGVCRPLSMPTSLERQLISTSPRSFSCSSLMSPNTLLTTLPTTSSFGCAATNLLPTSWTRCSRRAASIDFPGSVLAFATTRRRRYAVATAQGRECRI